MGLLTDTRTQAAMSRFILAVHKPLELLLYIAGVSSLLALAFTPLNDKTYFSENALLPGLVERKYQSEQDVLNYAKEMNRFAAADSGNGKIPVAWLQEQFLNLGLDVFAQNFTVKHPLMFRNESDRESGIIRGTNVYAILRAPRIASTEAMVFTVPYRNKDSEQDKGRTHYGIGLMLSLASFFAKNSYWSKDIIFVVVDKEEVGMQAWLESYHDTRSDYIASSLMIGRSGSIIAAINLELGSEFTDHIDLKIEGVNGQLPNLDLFNLAVRMCRIERVASTFQNRPDPSERLAVRWEGFKHSATTMLLNMAKQASGNPSGLHGIFLRYHIEALTLQAHSAKRGTSVVAVGRVLEGVVRSVNNLLERFHQSFFFYVLPSCDRYVSIGLYMIPFGLLLLVPTLHGLALWLQALQMTEQPSDEKDKDATEGDPQAAKSQTPKHQGRPFAQIMPLIIGAHITGVLLFVSPEYLVSNHISSFSITPQGAIAIGFLAFFVGTATLPLYGKGKNFQTSKDLQSDWQLLKSFTLIWYTTTLLAVSMFNFSLAFFVAAFTIPTAVLVQPTAWKVAKFLQGVAMLMISPLALLFSFHAIHHWVLNPGSSLSDILMHGVSQTMESLFEGVINSYIFGNKTFALVTVVWFPVWFLLWIVLFREPNVRT